MATKKKATKRKKPSAPEQPPAAPNPVGPTYTCRKCGNHESVTQLRKVVVDVGWALTQIHAIAPCVMCTKCGNNTVTVNAKIGDLAGLVPEMPLPQNPEDCDAEIARLEAMKAAMQRGAKKKGKRKGAKKKATKRR